MKRIIIILLALTICSMADIKINSTGYSDDKTFINDFGGKVFALVDNVEYSLNANCRQSPLITTYRISAGYDVDYNRYGTFIFASNELGATGTYSRLGIGIEYKPLENLLEFPYQHKFSIAEVLDSKYGALVSLRYKLNGYWEKIGFHVTAFHLGYSWNVDTRITYKIHSAVSLIHKSYFEEMQGTRAFNGSWGLEVSL